MAKLRRRNKHGYSIYIDDIQYLNILWVLASFVLLYYGISGDGQDMINAFLFIIYFFLLFWYLGIREKKKHRELAQQAALSENEPIPGDKALSQWEYSK